MTFKHLCCPSFSAIHCIVLLAVVSIELLPPDDLLTNLTADLAVAQKTHRSRKLTWI